MKKIRVFRTGATRDADINKPDIFGFLSSLSVKRYSDYMHEHRKQPDGSLRASDNWKLGIPEIEYVRSMNRHVNDLNLHYEGFGDRAREDRENALCAIIFNAQGLLFELLKKFDSKQSKRRVK